MERILVDTLSLLSDILYCRACSLQGINESVTFYTNIFDKENIIYILVTDGNRIYILAVQL